MLPTFGLIGGVSSEACLSPLPHTDTVVLVATTPLFCSVNTYIPLQCKSITSLYIMYMYQF